jgi:hypothetical protein
VHQLLLVCYQKTQLDHRALPPFYCFVLLFFALFVFVCLFVCFSCLVLIVCRSLSVAGNRAPHEAKCSTQRDTGMRLRYRGGGGGAPPPPPTPAPAPAASTGKKQLRQQQQPSFINNATVIIMDAPLGGSSAMDGTTATITITVVVVVVALRARDFSS